METGAPSVDGVIEETAPLDDGQGSSSEGTPVTAEIIEQIVAAVSEKVTDAVLQATDKSVDRRIGSLMKTLTTQYTVDKRGAGSGTPAAAPPDALSMRLLKSAVSETILADTWATPDEQKAARKLALRLAENLRPGDDEDDYSLAEKIVQQVKDTLQELRTTYASQERAELKRRGLLADDGEIEQGQPIKKKTGGAADPQKQYDQGAALARSKFGDRLKPPANAQRET